MGRGYLFPEIPVVVTAQQASIMLEICGEPKPGNVSEGKPFPDLSHEDFIYSAISVWEPLCDGYGKARRRDDDDEHLGGVFGSTLLSSAREAMSNRSNSIFGTLLVGIPLGVGACLSRKAGDIVPNARRLVAESDVEDSLNFGRAIEVCHVGGLEHQFIREEAVEMDLNRPDFDAVIERNGVRLGELLSLSTGYDLLADELTGGFQITSRYARVYLDLLRELHDPGRASGALFCTLLSRYPDTLVARKAGTEEAERVRGMAEEAMELDLGSTSWRESMENLDGYLRGKGLNPGTLADITSVSIFLALLDPGN